MMKVLVVDDNPINRLLPIAWLKRLGCETEESAGGTDALRIKQRHRPHRPRRTHARHVAIDRLEAAWLLACSASRL